MSWWLSAAMAMAMAGIADAEVPVAAPTPAGEASGTGTGTAAGTATGTATGSATATGTATAAAPAPMPVPAASDVGDQGVGTELGVATGGRVTPGGLRVSGHYYYQLSDQDWFDGTASFTFGGGGAACFRDRSANLVCDHGLASGAGIELTAAVRRIFDDRGGFRPFARVGVGFALVRFSDDQVSGVAVPLHGGGGVRIEVADGIAVVVEGELEVGLGVFDRGLGVEPHFGLALAAGAEFRLR